MKECLLCSAPLKLVKFKCAEGHVCKVCYEKVSLNFTQTIKTNTKEELLARLENEPTDAFEISRKVNQLILFDDNQQQLCLPNHKKYTKENLKPEFYPFSSILDCQVVEEQVEKIVKKKKQTLGTIKVVITFAGKQPVTRDIWLIPNLIDNTSMAYKTMRSLAESIIKEIDQSRNAAA
ncbi:hypothetical protein JZO70_07905 [Enterococcus sp. 669A]|uniref:DUF4428 domain-containing protein n=1 Tax=Candidatus Enterococcus moelleringii TaxID=2815325 RepID=A0ABS3L8Y3_9ENTE|nr:hypothetical protein [Enterococcus sp. 669A]